MPEFRFKLGGKEKGEHTVRVQYSQLKKNLDVFYDEKPYFSYNINSSNLIKLWIGEDLVELKVMIPFFYVPPVVEVHLNNQLIAKTDSTNSAESSTI